MRERAYPKSTNIFRSSNLSLNAEEDMGQRRLGVGVQGSASALNQVHPRTTAAGVGTAEGTAS